MNEQAAKLETLKCPFCGYELVREEHPGAAYCGPHHPDGHYSPAERMRVQKTPQPKPGVSL